MVNIMRAPKSNIVISNPAKMASITPAINQNREYTPAERAAFKRNSISVLNTTVDEIRESPAYGPRANNGGSGVVKIYPPGIPSHKILA